MEWEYSQPTSNMNFLRVLLFWGLISWSIRLISRLLDRIYKQPGRRDAAEVRPMMLYIWRSLYLYGSFPAILSAFYQRVFCFGSANLLLQDRHYRPKRAPWELNRSSFRLRHFYLLYLHDSSSSCISNPKLLKTFYVCSSSLL